MLRLHQWTQIRLLQIVPEHAAPQHHFEVRVAQQRFIQRLLQQSGIGRLCQFAGKTEHARVRAVRDRRENLGRVVQPGPFGRPHIVK